MTEAKKVKAWLPKNAKGETAGSVDGEKLGYGKENAIALTQDQIKRLRDSDVPVQIEKEEKTSS
jgi:hypothetical protein